MIKFENQIEKLKKKIAALDKWVEGRQKMISASGYADKTDPELQAKHRDEVSCFFVSVTEML